MKKLLLKATVVASVFAMTSCGGASVELDENMKGFVDTVSSSHSMMDAIEKYGANPDMETDLDLYELKEPTVSAVSEEGGKKCYDMNVKHGLIDSNCKVCWENDKVVSVEMAH